MSQAPAWECVLDAKASVAECPIYAPEQQALYWVDAYAPSMNRLDLRSGRNEAWKMPRSVGSYGLAADLKSCVIALADGLHRFEFASEKLTLLHAAPYDEKHYRFNDGRVDRAGRFWVGTLRRFDSSEPYGRGAFWRLDERGLERVIEGITIANGIAWSPDDRTMYLADRVNQQILAFDYDVAAGTVSNRRAFTKVSETAIPDGAAVDSEGFYWSAKMREGKVTRYAPDGSVDREIATPVTTPTMLAFGGEDLKTLFLTTSRMMLKPHEVDQQPLAGGLFALRVDVAGVPEPRLR